MKNFLLDLMKVIAFFLIEFIIVFGMFSLAEEPNPLQSATTIIIITIVYFASILVIYNVFNLITKKTVQFNKLSKVDFLGSKEYYRDILNNYSPILLAYLDKMQYSYETSIVAGLLSLQNKGFIEISEGGINIVKFDFSNLNLSERYLIENIKDGKMVIPENDDQLKNLIFEESKLKNLIISKKKATEIFFENKEKLNKSMIVIIIVAIMLNMFILKNVFMLIKIILISFIIGGLYISFFMINYQKNPYERTKRAKELNEKLEGLKNYLEEYSLLEDKDAQDIALWEDYLIYSVIFNQNKNIMSEYRKYYE